MRKVGMLMLALASVVAETTAPAVATENIEREDPLGSAVLTEVVSLEGLAAAIDTRIESLELSATEARDWARAKSLWGEARTAGEAHDFVTTFERNKEARRAAREVFRKVIAAGFTETEVAGLQKRLEALEGRMSTTEAQVANYRLTDEAARSVQIAKATMVDARKAMKKKSHADAARALEDIASALDVVMPEVYPPMRQ